MDEIIEEISVEGSDTAVRIVDDMPYESGKAYISFYGDTPEISCLFNILDASNYDIVLPGTIDQIMLVMEPRNIKKLMKIIKKGKLKVKQVAKGSNDGARLMLFSVSSK